MPIASWGTEVRRRKHGTPFLMFEPRPASLRELFAAGERWADREHVVAGDERLTFAEVARQARRAACELQGAHGVRPGDTVLLVGFNSLAWLVGFWGIVEAGGVVVLGNSWWSAAELQHAVSATSPTVIVADAAAARLVPPGSAWVDLQQLASDGDESQLDAPVPRSEDDPAVVIFTSGSTGLPKGVVLSHRACIAMQHALLHLTKRLPDQLPDDFPTDVNLQTGPLFHVGGVQGLIRAWLLGATMVLTVGRFDPAEILRLIDAERVCRWGAVPTMVSRVLASGDLPRHDRSTLRSLTVGGSPVPPGMFDAIRTAFPNVQRGVTQIYGLSEAGGTLAMASSADLHAHPGTVGRPLATVELAIDRPGPDGVGEILSRSPGQMTGYWGDAANTPIDEEGWLRTGDLGRIDDDGYLYITGREKDVIIRGGENIASAHVEAALRTHPAIDDVAVVGLPDADLGEVVGAVISVRHGSEVTTADLARHAQTHLAYFEVPTRWWDYDGAFPLTASGKVDKPALRRGFPNKVATHTEPHSRKGAVS